MAEPGPESQVGFVNGGKDKNTGRGEGWGGEVMGRRLSCPGQACSDFPERKLFAQPSVPSSGRDTLLPGLHQAR